MPEGELDHGLMTQLKIGEPIELGLLWMSLFTDPQNIAYSSKMNHRNVAHSCCLA